MQARPVINHHIYLHPAELVVAEEPTEITTVLGSCVSVTLFYPPLRFGSICHAVMPSGRDRRVSHYVDQSVRYMIEFFRRHRVPPRDLVAKVFGGADMLPSGRRTSTQPTVGAQNIRVALDTLGKAGLEPAVSDLGGHAGRKLVFYSHTGEIFLKRVSRDQLPIEEISPESALALAKRSGGNK